MSKTAVVTGVTGQDGAYLCKHLLERGYRVVGTYRRLSTPNFWRLQYLGVYDSIDLIAVDLADMASLTECVRAIEPDELYNLAAQSFVGASFEAPLATSDDSGVAVTRLLEAIRQISPETRFYQASTSEMFGGAIDQPCSETTPFSPRSPYAAAKLYAHGITRIYREAYGLFAATGILFNHESPLRGLEFVTRKITNTVAKIELGLEKKLKMGNVDAKRDWGYAPEYVDAIHKIVQHEIADDFVIGTGTAYTVREFGQCAFDHVNRSFEDYYEVDKRFLRPLEVNYLLADNSKATKELGWAPRTEMKQLARLMVEADLKNWSRYLDGEMFPWDAPFNINESRLLVRGLRA